MAAAYQWGYRVAMIVAGAAPLVLAEVYNWNLSYAVMAALMGIGVLGVLLAPARARSTRSARSPSSDVPSRPALEVVEWIVRLALIIAVRPDRRLGPDRQARPAGRRPDRAWARPRTPARLWPRLDRQAERRLRPARARWPGGLGRAGAGLLAHPGRQDPARRLSAPAPSASRCSDFFDRFGKLAGLILALICLYRLADFVLNIMNPFYLDLGFTKTEIAEVRKVFGVVCSMRRRRPRRLLGGAVRADPDHADRRLRQPALQPGVRLAGHPGPRACPPCSSPSASTTSPAASPAPR